VFGQTFGREPPQPTVFTTGLSTTSSRADLLNRVEADNPPEKLDKDPEDSKQATAPSIAARSLGAASAPAAATVPEVRDFATNDAKHYRERGISAYRTGDLHLALVDFDLAIQFDPTSPDTYIDRAIVFYRLGDRKNAFADIAKAKRLHESKSR